KGQRCGQCVESDHCLSPFRPGVGCSVLVGELRLFCDETSRLSTQRLVVLGSPIEGMPVRGFRVWATGLRFGEGARVTDDLVDDGDRSRDRGRGPGSTGDGVARCCSRQWPTLLALTSSSLSMRGPRSVNAANTAAAASLLVRARLQ